MKNKLIFSNTVATTASELGETLNMDSVSKQTYFQQYCSDDGVGAGRDIAYILMTLNIRHRGISKTWTRLVKHGLDSRLVKHGLD